MKTQPASYVMHVTRKPSSKLEAALIEYARIICQAEKLTMPVNSLQEFKARLEREMMWYCKDNHRARVGSVYVNLHEDVLYIGPSGKDLRQTATIQYERVQEDNLSLVSES